MQVIKIKKNTKIHFDNDLKINKYFIKQNKQVITFNRGRMLEYNIRYNYTGAKKIDLENISHKIAGDININGLEYNIKSYKCELKSEGVTLEQRVDSYIASDASNGLIYVIEHNADIFEIRMNWEEAREFLLQYGKIDRNAIRLTTCDRKIYEWATAQA